MVGLALAMFGLGLWSLLARLRGKLFDWDWLHRAAVLMGPAGFVAVIAGWVTTEVGRQPFTIYALMSTADPHSPLAAPAVAASLVAFILVYFAVVGAGTLLPAAVDVEATRTGGEEPVRVPPRATGITPAAGVTSTSWRRSERHG
jgi:cytochrome d ubiquinol oxidase subunit I